MKIREMVSVYQALVTVRKSEALICFFSKRVNKKLEIVLIFAFQLTFNFNFMTSNFWIFSTVPISSNHFF